MIALVVALLAAAPPARAPVPPAAPSGTPAYEVWNLDQLRIDSGTDPKVLDAIAPVKSLDEAIAVLTARGVHYLRTRAVLLSSRLPADVRATIDALPAGEPFVFPEGRFISISVIVSRQPAPAGVRARPSSTSLPAARAS